MRHEKWASSPASEVFSGRGFLLPFLISGHTGWRFKRLESKTGKTSYFVAGFAARYERVGTHTFDTPGQADSGYR